MKKNNILKNIGVIIPAYNEEKNVERLINSIKKNLSNPFIFLVDDSSGYKTSNIIKKKTQNKILSPEN